MNANLFDILETGITDPDATAIETAGGQRISYGDLVARTGRMANALAGLGVKPGDRVAAQVEKSVQAIILYLATVRAGAVFLPLNTGYTPSEIDYFIGDATPAILVSDPARADALSDAAARAGIEVSEMDMRGAHGRVAHDTAAARRCGARGRAASFRDRHESRLRTWPRHRANQPSSASSTAARTATPLAT